MERLTATLATAPAADLAVVIVHYHAARELAAATAALRRDLEASGLVAEWRIVDNGSTPQEREEIASLGLPTIEGGGNRGFAAGVNRGIATATAPVFLVLNPDVEVLPGCARALLDELERGTGAAAPRLYWDPDRRFLLPVGEERSRRWEILALAARYRPACASRARRRWRRDVRRHWEAAGSLRSLRLSGAILAVPRSVWMRVGPFDEGYRLYFEETEWLLRLAAAGFEARQARGAEAVHGFARSTRHEPEAAAWFTDSARRFRAARYGRWFVRLCDRLAALLERRRSIPPPLPRWSEGGLSGVAAAAPSRGVVWLELSPNVEGFPAAGTRVARADLAAWSPPRELMEASGLAGMSLCVTSDGGRELGRWWIDGGPGGAGPPAMREPARDQNRSPSPMAR